MSKRSIWVIAVLLLAGLMAGGAAAPAGAQGSLGISAGTYQPDDDELDSTEVFGIRGGYRFNPNFGIEANLSRVDLADSIPTDNESELPDLNVDFKVDLYNLDLSLQWYPRGGHFLVFAGPGVAQIDARVDFRIFGTTISDSDTSQIFTAHAGLAYDWQINDRFFIRPEARVRRYFDDDPRASEDQGTFIAVSYDATDYEAGIVFGWRIGS